MLHRIRTQTQNLGAALFVALVLSACSDDAKQSSQESALVDINYAPTVFISFESGPNAGRHQYRIDESSGGKIELKYNRASDVTLLELRGLVSIDGKLRLDELRRFTKGSLLVGSNMASSWRGEPIRGDLECGLVNFRDPNHTQTYENGFGKYQSCGATSVDFVSDWKNATESLIKMRITKGRFEDRVKFNIAMDSEPFQRFEAGMTVEFDVLETSAR